MIVVGGLVNVNIKIKVTNKFHQFSTIFAHRGAPSFGSMTVFVYGHWVNTCDAYLFTQ